MGNTEKRDQKRKSLESEGMKKTSKQRKELSTIKKGKKIFLPLR